MSQLNLNLCLTAFSPKASPPAGDNLKSCLPIGRQRLFWIIIKLLATSNLPGALDIGMLTNLITRIMVKEVIQKVLGAGKRLP
jgi:hypothetical protein